MLARNFFTSNLETGEYTYYLRLKLNNLVLPFYKIIQQGNTIFQSRVYLYLVKYEFRIVQTQTRKDIASFVLCVSFLLAAMTDSIKFPSASFYFFIIKQRTNKVIETKLHGSCLVYKRKLYRNRAHIRKRIQLAPL